MGKLEPTLFGGQREGGAFLDSPSSAQQEETLPFVLMTLADETFAIEIGKVREIIRVPLITWVPGSSMYIRGVINLRGSVVAVVDLAALFSHPVTELGSYSRIVVVESSDEMVGILVDSVSQVAGIVPSSLESPMRTLDEGQRKYLQAQTSRDDLMIGLLDIGKIIEEARAVFKAT